MFTKRIRTTLSAGAMTLVTAAGLGAFTAAPAQADAQQEICYQYSTDICNVYTRSTMQAAIDAAVARMQQIAATSLYYQIQRNPIQPKTQVVTANRKP